MRKMKIDRELARKILDFFAKKMKRSCWMIVNGIHQESSNLVLEDNDYDDSGWLLVAVRNEKKDGICSKFPKKDGVWPEVYVVERCLKMLEAGDDIVAVDNKHDIDVIFKGPLALENILIEMGLSNYA